MNNENNRLTHPENYQTNNSQNLHYKLASLLALIVTFQEKIEILRTKLCGHPNFSPELYYKQIDRNQKGYIDSQDLITFIKKSKPTFNIDNRYLKSLFNKLNQDQKIPKDRLTYFGYLNIIKPHFDTKLARDVLLRDSVAIGMEINLVTKKLLEELICTLYVCVAEHQQIKELIIFGDVQQGGSSVGNLFNIYQVLDIIRENGQPIQSTARQIVGNIGTQLSIDPIPPTNNFISSTQLQNINTINPIKTPSNASNTSKPSGILISSRNNLSRADKATILDTFYYYIIRNSQYQIEKNDMKYLLAYLMCHQFMITQEKYLTVLFMPVCGDLEIGIISHSHTRSGTKKQKINIPTSSISTPPQSDTNFLTYIHPNSISNQHLEQYKKIQKPPNTLTRPHKNTRISHNPQIRSSTNIHTNNSNKLIKNYPEYSSHKLIDDQPRVLVNGSQYHILQTPILERFMRQSKVLKNMSRYKPDIIQQQSSNSSAFISQSKYNQKTPKPHTHTHTHNNIAKQHIQKPINKDFNLQDVLNNSNLHQSQYYQNVSMRAFVKNQGLRPVGTDVSARKYQFEGGMGGLEGSGVLGNFMRR